MLKRIIQSTDRKFLGHTFNDDDPIILDGVEFIPTNIVQINEKHTRYFNSNYTIVVEDA